MAQIATLFLALICFVTFTNCFKLPADSHAVFRDHTGVFVLNTNKQILNKINKGKRVNKIKSNEKIRQQTRRKFLTTSQNEQLLDIHNEYRSITALGETPDQPAGTNINELMWDPYLAQVAQEYSTNCVWEHNPDRVDQFGEYDGETEYMFDIDQLSVGENIFYTTDFSDIDASLTYGIQLYYDEYEYYTFNNDTSGCCSNVCGHYTQVIWANTRYVGCGYTICSDGIDGTDTATLFSVCNYFPAGNYAGSSPYYAGCSCSNCQSDRICNQDGLCGGCPSLDYSYCQDYYSNCDELTDSCPDEGCFLNSTDSVCVGCRTSCNTCNSDILAPRDQCDDGTASDIDGLFDGRDVTIPESPSVFSGSPNCDGDDVITICDEDSGDDGDGGNYANMQCILINILFSLFFMLCH